MTISDRAGASGRALTAESVLSRAGLFWCLQIDPTARDVRETATRTSCRRRTDPRSPPETASGPGGHANLSQRLHDLGGVQDVRPVGRIAKEDRRGRRRRRDRFGRYSRLPSGPGRERERRLVVRPDLTFAIYEVRHISKVPEPDVWAARKALSLQYQHGRQGTRSRYSMRAIRGSRSARRAASSMALRGANLTDAAISAGFSDSAHFSRLHHETFGVTPSYSRQAARATIAARKERQR